MGTTSGADPSLLAESSSDSMLHRLRRKIPALFSPSRNEPEGSSALSVESDSLQMSSPVQGEDSESAFDSNPSIERTPTPESGRPEGPEPRSDSDPLDEFSPEIGLDLSPENPAEPCEQPLERLDNPDRASVPKFGTDEDSRHQPDLDPPAEFSTETAQHQSGEAPPEPSSDTTEQLMELQETLSDPTDVTAEQLMKQLKLLEHAFSALRAEVESKALQDAFRDATIDRLHAEVQDYKQGLLNQALEPIYRDIIMVHDHLGQVMDRGHTPEGKESAPEMNELLRSFQTEIEDLLFKHRVEVFREPEDNFVAGRQRALKTVPAPSTDLTGRVKTRVRVGFERSGDVLRPELVEVYGRSTPLDSEVSEDG